MDENELRQKAEQRVEARIEFRQHLIIYLVVNAFIFAIWLVVALVVGGSAWFPWFVFPLGGWGIGLIMHAISVFGGSEARRQKMIDREMERLRSDK